DGVPLFVEELTKAALERPSGRASRLRPHAAFGHFSDFVPATLRGSLLARLDRLGSAKTVPQTPSLIAKKFSYETLTQLSPSSLPLDAALDALVTARLILPRGVAPLAMYAFKHALIRDASYDTLLRGDRKRLHLALAAILQEQDADGEVTPQLVAYHLENGGS